MMSAQSPVGIVIQNVKKRLFGKMYGLLESGFLAKQCIESARGDKPSRASSFVPLIELYTGRT